MTLDVRERWQQELAQSYTNPLQLAEFLGLSPAWAEQHNAARKLFPMRVPQPFVRLMEKGNEQDPLLLQVMPLISEFEQLPGFTNDPLAEAEHSPVPGLLHKYQSRVLIILRGGCAVNCRYCFRRHFPYEDHQLKRDDWDSIERYLSNHPQINEVILSGGDPLMAKEQHLLEAIQRIERFANIKRLRIHTRLPVVIPSRLTQSLLNVLTSSRLQSILVLHANHAREVSPELKRQLEKFRQQGVWILNQSVLLKDINDSVEALTALSEALFQAGIQPYYLHQLDAVAGAAHFAVADTEAVRLSAELRKQLPGFLVPTLVREIPGEPNKTPL
ncbi:EF-P beta-lysylation protein EpmB [Aliidiomarina haloalkalitolerans]|uniref:L-lysine 2,3-aminomutase n=1 Tax=Aliidiomarina haloalkalitolerans TaxID=859059 RepID=A0A432VVB6_9GAMM|nr:EF-P beta-lysylation protein EpmB [Aliidiomarina haloalkalitolerans]RUO20328.1 EF-P beta-lysylation protein EpmB [Aliidiomarina haloalkalitolerans]